MKKYKKIILIIIILSLPILYIIINNYLSRPSGDENVTTKLNSDTDFLNWFIDFDTLYQEKIKSPKYSLNKDMFISINNFIDNTYESNVIYKDNTYYVDNITLELDVNTRSLRYISNDEVLEINLLNGKYYIQFEINNYLYKIVLNKNKSKINKYEDSVISSSIYRNNNFTW